MTQDLTTFVKQAAEFSVQAGDMAAMAYDIVSEKNTETQKVAAMIPETLNRMASLDRVNGQPMLPEGFAKQAQASLASHASTIKLLNQVLGEYEQLKAASDRLLPPIGSANTGTGVQKMPKHASSSFDSEERAAAIGSLSSFTERFANL